MRRKILRTLLLTSTLLTAHVGATPHVADSSSAPPEMPPLVRLGAAILEYLDALNPSPLPVQDLAETGQQMDPDG